MNEAVFPTCSPCDSSLCLSKDHGLSESTSVVLAKAGSDGRGLKEVKTIQLLAPGFEGHVPCHASHEPSSTSVIANLHLWKPVFILRMTENSRACLVLFPVHALPQNCAICIFSVRGKMRDWLVSQQHLKPTSQPAEFRVRRSFPGIESSPWG